MIKALFITTLLDKNNMCDVHISVFLHSLIKTLQYLNIDLMYNLRSIYTSTIGQVCPTHPVLFR